MWFCTWKVHLSCIGGLKNNLGCSTWCLGAERFREEGNSSRHSGGQFEYCSWHTCASWQSNTVSQPRTFDCG